ncbi:MAG: PspA/IM30 family protein [Microvirga sp.]
MPCARLTRERLAGLDEKARFALGQGRDDLAEAAVTRQLEFEAQAERLQAVQAEAEQEAGRLEECLAALTGRKAQMEEELASFEIAQRDAALGGDGPTRPGRRTERKVDRAEAAFDRAMAGAGGAAGVSRTDAKAAAKVAELEVMQKSAVVAQRLAALRAAHQGSA